MVRVVCFGDIFSLTVFGGWSGLNINGMELNKGKSWQKPVSGCKSLGTGAEVHLPLRQQTKDPSSATMEDLIPLHVFISKLKRYLSLNRKSTYVIVKFYLNPQVEISKHLHLDILMVKGREFNRLDLLFFS